MRQDCPECQRLWREYAAATTSHIRLENKLQSYGAEPDPNAVESFKEEVAEAARLREACREAIQRHETGAHGTDVDPSSLGLGHRL